MKKLRQNSTGQSALWIYNPGLDLIVGCGAGWAPLMLLTLLLSHFWLRLLPWIFTIYLTWSPWHYSGQNYGLFMMFARRAGADPDKSTRRALYGAFVVSYLVLFLGFHTGPSTDPLFLSLGIPTVISRWEQIILCIAFVVLSVYGLGNLASATGWRKLIP